MSQCGNSRDRHLPLCGGAAGSCTVTQSPPAARGVRVRVPSCAWVMRLNCQAEDDTCMVGAYAFGAATKRIAKRGNELWSELLAGVLDREHHILGVNAANRSLAIYGWRARSTA